MNEFDKKIKAASERIAAILAEAEVAGGFTPEQETEVAELEASITKLEADKAKAAEIAARIKSLNAGPGRKTAPGAGAPMVTKDLSEDDPKRGFKTPKDFLLSVIEAGASGRIDDRLRPLRSMAAGSDEHGEYSNAYGGFAVPEAFQPDPKMLSWEGDPTAGMTTRIPMSNPVVRMNARTDKNHTSSVSGGFRVYRRAETETVDPTRAPMEQVTLNAHTLMGVSYATEELLTDSPVSFAAMISRGFNDEMAATILNEKLRGTGAGEYEGILNSPCLVTVSAETGQSADTILYANIVKMLARCWRSERAVWLVNHDTLPQLMNMADGFGRFIWQQSAREGAPATILGRPVYVSEFASAIGDVGDIILGVWSEYLEGQLQGMQSAESMHVRFLNNERTFRVSMRNDGRCWWRSALTPAKSSSTLSPFVVLAAR